VVAWSPIYLHTRESMKTYWGSGRIAPRILNLATRWMWVVSFTPRERTLDTHWIWGWVGPRTGLDTVSKRKIPSPCWGPITRSPDRPARSQMLYRL